LARAKINKDTIVFVLTTRDNYIRNACLRRGWVENDGVNKMIFDIRWDLNGNGMNFDELRKGQLFNHFGYNEELTTKIGLARNLQRVGEARSFFPRCYDFTDPGAITDFIKDFEQTAVINLLKKHAELYIKFHSQ